MIHSTHLPSSACSIAPGTFTVNPGQLVPIDITFNTAGLTPNEYDVAFGIVAQTPNSLPINQTYTAKLSIRAKAFASTTMVSTSGSPTIGDDWDGVHIYPHDSDGLAISNDNGEDLSVSLRSPTGVLASCAVTWAGLYYQGKCNIPVVSEAGEWNLTISLDDDVFRSSSVSMMCEEGYYENPTTEACDLCPRGTTCPMGTTLESMQIDQGFWRSGTVAFVLFIRCCLAITWNRPSNRYLVIRRSGVWECGTRFLSWHRYDQQRDLPRGGIGGKPVLRLRISRPFVL